METVANSVVRTMSGPCKRLTKKNSVVSGNSSLMIGIVMEAEVSPGGKRRAPILSTKSEPSMEEGGGEERDATQ